MKEYPKTYEDYFQGTQKRNRVIRPESFRFNGLEEEQFAAYYDQLLREFFAWVWLTAVRNIWLAFHFQRDGEPTYGDSLLLVRPYGPAAKSQTGRAMYASHMFAAYPRHKLGIDRRAMIESFAIRQAGTYVLEVFTRDFMLSGNPFTDPDRYVLPYKSVTLDLMLAVYQMQERMDIIKIAEERGMRWEQFMDYVLNYIHSYNEENGKRIFSMVVRQPFPIYVRDARRVKSVWASPAGQGKKGAVLYEKPEEGVPKL